MSVEALLLRADKALEGIRGDITVALFRRTIRPEKVRRWRLKAEEAARKFKELEDVLNQQNGTD